LVSLDQLAQSALLARQARQVTPALQEALELPDLKVRQVSVVIRGDQEQEELSERLDPLVH